MKSHFLFLVALIFIGISSCGKYPDGPKFSLISKEKRLIKNWKMNKVEYYNGQNSTYSEGQVYPFYLNIEKSGVLKYKRLVDNNIQEFSSSWTWHLGTWGITLDLTNNILGNNGVRNYQIKRLTKTELWIYDRATGHNYYFESI